MIKALQHGLELLGLVGANGSEGVSISEASSYTGLHPSSCMRLMHTLEQYGYIMRFAGGKRYYPGPRSKVPLSERPLDEQLTKIGVPFMEALTASIRETAVLVCLSHDRRNSLCAMDSMQMRISVPNDFYHTSVYRSTAGRMLLAYLSPVELDGFVRRNGLPTGLWPEAKTRARLQVLLRRIRRKGQYWDTNPDNISSTAVPVLMGNTVVAAVGVYLPATRFQGPHRGRIMEETRRCGNGISAALSARSK